MTRRDMEVIVVAAVGMGLVALACLGCGSGPSAHTVSGNYSLGDAPQDWPHDTDIQSYDDCLSGGRIFQMYCGACHNARPLSERPFSNYEVASAHMREQAYLTGKEYRQLIHFLRRWHNVGPPTSEVEPSPKRFYFSQPLDELRDRQPEQLPAPIHSPPAMAPPANGQSDA
jgi:hypothetical protein